jgi:hypothetical protein
MAKAKRKGANVAPLPDRLTRRRLLRAKINKPDLWVIAAVVDTRSLPCDRGGGVAAVALNGGSTMGVVHVSVHRNLPRRCYRAGTGRAPVSAMRGTEARGSDMQHGLQVNELVCRGCWLKREAHAHSLSLLFERAALSPQKSISKQHAFFRCRPPTGLEDSPPGADVSPLGCSLEMHQPCFPASSCLTKSARGVGAFRERQVMTLSDVSAGKGRKRGHIVLCWGSRPV